MIQILNEYEFLFKEKENILEHFLDLKFNVTRKCVRPCPAETIKLRIAEAKSSK